MKLNYRLALFFSVLFSSALTYAFDLPVPQKLIEHHSKICPDFITRGLPSVGYTLPVSGKGEPDKIFILGCEIFAYNSLEKAYIVDSKENIKEVYVAEIDYKGDWSATSDLMGASYDEVTRTLSTFQKGRGIGDCGSAALYFFTPGDDKFILIEQRLKMHCDGDTESDWPVIYRKKN